MATRQSSVWVTVCPLVILRGEISAVICSIFCSSLLTKLLRSCNLARSLHFFGFAFCVLNLKFGLCRGGGF